MTLQNVNVFHLLPVHNSYAEVDLRPSNPSQSNPAVSTPPSNTPKASLTPFLRVNHRPKIYCHRCSLRLKKPPKSILPRLIILPISWFRAGKIEKQRGLVGPYQMHSHSVSIWHLCCSGLVEPLPCFLWPGYLCFLVRLICSSAHQYSPRRRFYSSHCHCYHFTDSGSYLRLRDCCKHNSIEIRRRWRVRSGFFVISQRASSVQCDQPGTCTYSVLWRFPHARRRYFNNGLQLIHTNVKFQPSARDASKNRKYDIAVPIWSPSGTSAIVWF